MREPNSRVTALDVSSASLRHTRELQQRYALDNLDLHQLPLESIEDLGRRFDLIVCTGVLHHLPDPDAGLRALRAVLSRRGAIHLMVYAAFGRAGIYMLQEYCRLLHMGTSASDLRALESLLKALPLDHPLSNLLNRAADFREPDALADALLHPQDRAYTVPQLYAMLERCGFSFGRWVEQAPYLPQCGAMALASRSKPLDFLPEAAQHAAAELFRGTMTQHRLIAYRTDYSSATWQIEFGGEQWCDYVPLRLPGTLCIREKLPPQCAAVLINRAHEYRDLLLALDAQQERMLMQIDGRRTMRDILTAVGSSAGAERSLAFFKSLWSYDQIVIDATQSSGHSSRVAV